MEDGSKKLYFGLVIKMESVIKVQNLTKTFTLRQNNNLITGLFNPKKREVKAVNDITFSVQRGESVAFLGPNGAGKTTTTKMLTGLIHPTAGTVEVLGYNPFGRDHSFLRRIGLVMGNKSGLSWDLTPEQSFWLLKNIYRIPDEAYKTRLKELTELLDVQEHLKTQLRRLSLGERMKVELIGAILHNPEVLFLDEPTIGLDITARKNIRTFLRKVQKENNVTLVLTSHDMDDIEHVCDRVIVINHGVKVYDDSIEALTAQYQKERYVRLVFENGPPKEELEKYGKILEHDNGNFLIKVPEDNVVSLVEGLNKGKNLIDIHMESVPLEQMIDSIFRKSS